MLSWWHWRKYAGFLRRGELVGRGLERPRKSAVYYVCVGRPLELSMRGKAESVAQNAPGIAPTGPGDFRYVPLVATGAQPYMLR
jgi:hypothetical protein